MQAMPNNNNNNNNNNKTQQYNDFQSMKFKYS